MIKKFFAIAIVAASMSLVSCGGGSDTDKLINKINSCTNAADIMKLSQDKDFEEMYNNLPKEEKQRVDSAALEKGNELMGKAMDQLGDAMQSAMDEMGN